MAGPHQLQFPRNPTSLKYGVAAGGLKRSDAEVAGPRRCPEDGMFSRYSVGH